MVVPIFGSINRNSLFLKKVDGLNFDGTQLFDPFLYTKKCHMGDVEFNMLTIVTALLCYVNKCKLINILYSEMNTL